MLKKHNNKGFSLIELIIVITILAVVVSILIPSFIHLVQESRVKKDNTKFESIGIAFKAAMAEPEVQNEVELLGGGDLTVVCYIDANGLITFGDGELFGNTKKKLENTALWLNSYQTVGTTYTTESKDFCQQYLVFNITPKTTTTTASCEYTILNEHPLLQEEGVR